MSFWDSISLENSQLELLVKQIDQLVKSSITMIIQTYLYQPKVMKCVYELPEEMGNPLKEYI